MQVFVANPHGYCEGVVHAIALAEQVRREYPNTPIDVLGMLVHNEKVIQQLKENQITTIKIPISHYADFLSNVDASHIIIFTAHGHDRKLDQIATQRKLHTIDATCNKVYDSFLLIENALNAGREVIYLGKKGHPEAEAALSRGKDVYLYDVDQDFNYQQLKTNNPLVISQTTLSILELKGCHLDILAMLPNAEIGNEVCSVTRLRQTAVQQLPSFVDAIYIIGSTQSSNTTKLAQIAKISHPQAKVRHIAELSELDQSELNQFSAVGVASGASTPLFITNEIIEFLKHYQ